MILSRTPLRISFFGGSSDNPEFIKKYKESLVINFSSNIYTYASIFRDKIGQNTIHNKFIMNYSIREESKNLNMIKNKLLKESIKYHRLPPVTFYLTSDIFSQGSGLASSSSYILSISKEALLIERKFNKFCGYQDPLGCGIKGLKIISTNNDKDYRIKKINYNIFKNYKFYLLPTFISRNSDTILESLAKNVDDIYPILEVAKEAKKYLLNKDLLRFFNLMNISWDLKKKSNILIMNNKKLIKLDNTLHKNDQILAHKLLGAGSGGYFLIVTNKKTKLNINKYLLQIQVSND